MVVINCFDLNYQIYKMVHFNKHLSCDYSLPHSL